MKNEMFILYIFLKIYGTKICMCIIDKIFKHFEIRIGILSRRRFC